MDRERLQYQGRLREKELEAERLALKARGLRDSLRLHLDPFAKVEEIEAEIAFQEMTDLARTVLDLRAVRAEIAAVKKALGLG